ncbi:hypothetical protein JOC86_000652 [Bacillus pakistanensis]|uniref:Photosystem I assembly protein Ycf4 n=1 Tax=Rossellomorea pakistanensis TaxID=992288 RepID=A0ABS2N8K6_9BACI|nr:hypothetical protein [Bacillus pakistanensis]MBM7584115.1 hypothetical protein [Bacillus pakistanensis]
MITLLFEASTDFIIYPIYIGFIFSLLISFAWSWFELHSFQDRYRHDNTYNHFVQQTEFIPLLRTHFPFSIIQWISKNIRSIIYVSDDEEFPSLSLNAL